MDIFNFYHINIIKIILVFKNTLDKYYMRKLNYKIKDD